MQSAAALQSVREAFEAQGKAKTEKKPALKRHAAGQTWCAVKVQASSSVTRDLGIAGQQWPGSLAGVRPSMARCLVEPLLLNAMKCGRAQTCSSKADCEVAYRMRMLSICGH